MEKDSINKNEKHYLTGREVREIDKQNSKKMRELEKRKMRKCKEEEFLSLLTIKPQSITNHLNLCQQIK